MDNTNAAATVAATMTDADLVRVRAAIEAEMLAAMATGATGTHAHLGQIELLEAAGNEIARRIDAVGRASFNLAPAPFVDVCHEDGRRASVTVRVF